MLMATPFDSGDPAVPLLLAWPTAGKRASLAESVEGFARNLAEHGRVAPILLATDSPFESLDPAVTAKTAGSARTHGLPFLVSDAKVRERFLNRLERDFDPETVGYAFLPHRDGKGSGRNYNAIMLAAAGGIAVSTDDDVLCRPALRRGCRGPRAAAYTKAVFPLDYLFRKDREEVLADVEPLGLDVAAEHLRFLGVGAAEFTDERLPDGAGTVTLTSPGTYGDSGFGRARTVLSLKGRARDEMKARGYSSLKYSREVLRIAETNLVGPSMNFMAMQSGWDCRRPLPPFLPAGRNPDGFFAFIHRLLDPASLTAFLGFGYLHDSGEPRSFDPASLTAFKPYLSELLMALALRCRPSFGTEGVKERFRELAENLEAAASARTNEFAHFLHDAWSEGAEAYAASLEKALDEDLPSEWAEDTKTHLEAVYETLREPSYLFGERGCGLSAEQVRGHAASYGRLLGIWPDLLEAAARLDRDGRGISEERRPAGA